MTRELNHHRLLLGGGSVAFWSCPYQIGHPFNLYSSLLYLLGDFIFHPCGDNTDWSLHAKVL
jgi:hypothetical protein